ncbi:serine/threonine protein kinase [Amycolatopsis sp. NBRC 101858]|uniref:serine/threonine-protein kinase n=1 Tax=Amycolatopsis sp. NBRC 101858 TaxID=3032200 RepID=UPI0024A074A1|nr:serine/threonine protein kinase [Amycolatopsis sp. NBRC 101858]GLY38579.1 serine/threonine protein kinase [Amycolatopsis sp. NBRC 101858]
MSDADDVTCARFDLGEFAVTPRPLDERPPELLAGRYEVGRLIGSGGSARVYRAYDLRLEREVAVKVYDRDVVALDQRRRLREMSIQAGITHPGVVALLDSGTDHGRTYLVMQLVEGENLAERLLGGPMPTDRVTALADGLAEALAHVHARRIVHRDLKPANVFLSAHGPLIGDFGIAHALDTTHITGTGVVPGTAAYLAPEQVSGEPAGPPADVYALGLILLECVTGHREYAGTMIEAAMARLTRPPRIPEGLPPSLAHTIRRMTRREPSDRPTADEVRRLLHAPPPTLPWATGGRFAAAGMLRRWHRATPAGRGLLGATGRRRAAEADGGQVGGAIAGDSGQFDAPASGPGAAGDHQPTDSTPGHPDPRAHTSTDRGPFDAPASGPFDPTLADTGIPHQATTPSGPRKILAAVGLSAASLPAQRRRFTAAAGLTAAAVAAVSAMVLSSHAPETRTPAQPPAPSSSAPTPEPLAGSGTPDPAGPAVTESADLEPAAVTRPAQSAPKTTKPGKPPKTEPHGNGNGNGINKGKGKGPGHD